MALRKNVTKHCPIPHEEGAWMELRLLGFQELQESKDVRSRKSLENVRLLGGDIYKAIQEAAPSARSEIDPLTEHDVMTLLVKGIVAWSYEDGKPTPEAIATLDDQTAQWAARVILGADPEDAEKNSPSSGSSTEPSTE